MTFESLGLSPTMIETLARKGFEEPTPIQALAIPRLLSPGPAIAAKARTGTGKTAAFGIPLVEALQEREAGGLSPAGGRPPVAALVLVPTRELALQVTEEISSLRSSARPRIACVYGGASIGEQLRRLSQGADIVVGTPGRVLDHIGRGSLDVSALSYFILDEADEMLDMGFIDDIRAVMETMNPEVRMLLFSATLAAPVLDIVRERSGKIEIIEDASETFTTELAEQLWIEVHSRDRLEALCRIVDSEEDFYGIVFVSTKVEADKLASSLVERGYDAEGLHGDLSQEARERVLGKFRDRRLSILVATDVAARGIDIEKLSHVINWSLPHDPESYLHRVGRTGRAGNTGTAITFVTPEEYRKLFRIKKLSGRQLKKAKVPEVEGILKLRKERLAAKVAAKAIVLAEDEASGEIWTKVAREILESLEPEAALAAALAEGFSGQLDPGRYRELTAVSVDETGTSRLYVAAGKKDRLTPRTLVGMIKRISNLPDSLIGSVEIYEAFSFVSVPFKYAERIIEEARHAGGFPAVRRATPKGPAGSHGGGDRERGDREVPAHAGSWKDRADSRKTRADYSRDGRQRPQHGPATGTAHPRKDWQRKQGRDTFHK
jgi:ATP-dependent RNA helicase DeaD